MITRYIQKALERARFEKLDDSSCCATVRGLRGVVAIERNEAECRTALTETVEEWVLVRVARHLPVPKLGGVTIRVR